MFQFFVLKLIMLYIESMYSIMKALFAYNFNKPRMKNDNNKIETTESNPKFGGPNSAFTPYRIHNEVALPEVRYERKDAFRKLKVMFGISEKVCIENDSADMSSTSQK